MPEIDPTASMRLILVMLLGAHGASSFLVRQQSHLQHSATASCLHVASMSPDQLSSSIQESFSTYSNCKCIANQLPSLLVGSRNVVLDSIYSEERPFQYLFMLPTMTLVATCCQLAGIGGAALLSPIFLLGFPLLGPSYPLPTAAAAIASALLTEVFGFASGLSGYARRDLVDWTVAFQFMLVSVPSALAGAICASTVASNPTLLRGVYSILMLGLSYYLITSEPPDKLALLNEECNVESVDEAASVRQLTASDGTEFTYLSPKQGDFKSSGITFAGSALTGLLGVGVGEVVLPQLVRKCCMPLPIAAGTSVAVVVVTALTAALVQFLSLASEVVGDTVAPAFDSSYAGAVLNGLVQVVPWNLVQFTVPGALLGGQVAPYLASRQVFSDDAIEMFTASLFGVVGIAFGIKCLVG